MGYTHYWNTARFTDEQWEKLCNATRNLITLAVKQGIYVDRECDDEDHPPLIDSKVIAFNGRGDDGHETFIFDKNIDGFQFCKTSLKPYDAVVVAVLILAHHFNNDFVWISDGDAEDFDAGKELAVQALGGASIEDLGIDNE